MRAVVLIALVVFAVGLRTAPVHSPRARLPRGHAAPQLLGGQPRRTPVTLTIGGS